MKRTILGIMYLGVDLVNLSQDRNPRDLVPSWCTAYDIRNELRQVYPSTYRAGGNLTMINSHLRQLREEGLVRSKLTEYEILYMLTENGKQAFLSDPSVMVTWENTATAMLLYSLRSDIDRTKPWPSSWAYHY